MCCISCFQAERDEISLGSLPGIALSSIFCFRGWFAEAPTIRMR